MTRPVSRLFDGSSIKFAVQRPSPMPSQTYFTVLSATEGVPFGFGSMSPARPEIKCTDVPGPGRYDPIHKHKYIESIRGHGLGFTSRTKRKLEFIKASSTPAPNSYLPIIVSKVIKTKIGNIPKGNRASFCPDERESASTPGPGSYSIERPSVRTPSAAFKSKVERNLWGIREKKRVNFDGRTLVIQANAL